MTEPPSKKLNLDIATTSTCATWTHAALTENGCSNGYIKHDEYCWSCHDKDANKHCSKCMRSYHGKCLKSTKICDSNWMCEVCIRLNDATKSTKKCDVATLRMIMNKFYNNDEFKSLKMPIDDSESKIVNSINLSSMNEKIASYTSLDMLMADAQWILHNCTIVYPGRHLNTTAAKNLVDELNDEIEYFEICAECYDDRSFSRACKHPHLLIWCKFPSSCYWPAKVMKRVNGWINVRFFGEHTYYVVLAKKCFLYTPNKAISAVPRSSQRSSLNAALEEANDYIKNLSEKFGDVKFSTKKTVVNPSMIDEYLRQMVPGYKPSNPKPVDHHHQMDVKSTSTNSDIVEQQMADIFGPSDDEDPILIESSPESSPKKPIKRSLRIKNSNHSERDDERDDERAMHGGSIGKNPMAEQSLAEFDWSNTLDSVLFNGNQNSNHSERADERTNQNDAMHGGWQSLAEKAMEMGRGMQNMLREVSNGNQNSNHSERADERTNQNDAMHGGWQSLAEKAMEMGREMQNMIIENEKKGLRQKISALENEIKKLQHCIRGMNHVCNYYCTIIGSVYCNESCRNNAVVGSNMPNLVEHQ